ncbi:hypothetical protein VF14_03190 [Nostoc linckia z18]|uniref:Uncharacterized protein n=2 Tax=Nostoc linckia TaxID=92942 RepID=A0A9Q5ZHB5_NOSLI|nr:hypothetical protein [Nostoc linckia]PHK42385.1 hypothetical protein VF12_03205 [Nostoc linckia z15]PHK46826.1 hypothetical protein VF13_09075 [Nostoc linckia z16]PHJ69155.1 hypothetical protein VF02_00660 [Nostoc linckia z1]PHJ73306.1 hypothetical protein VF05_01675 [Nostoc linckia z3]PHJ78653.1 hypothetical protein VF03_00660 [Nostoc linckia z2]
MALFGKYIIQKADGTPIDPNAQYFVLRPDTDKAARVAIRAYIQELSDSDEDAALKQDLIAWIKNLDEKDRKNAMRRQAARYGDGSAWEEYGTWQGH